MRRGLAFSRRRTTERQAGRKRSYYSKASHRIEGRRKAAFVFLRTHEGPREAALCASWGEERVLAL
jgi:hypothetical protein